MELERKHLTPYLDHELQGIVHDNLETLWGLPGSGDIETNEGDYEIEAFKPLLHPLDMLTKEIEHNGEKFIPIIRMVAECHSWMDYYNQGIGKFGEDIKSRPKYRIYNVGYGDMQIHWKVELGYLPNMEFGYVQKLFEWHFDVFGLIPEGLAINKLTNK